MTEKGDSILYFHICVRGNAYQSMFLENHDIYHAIDLLGIFALEYNVVVIAYDFLSNHFHLIVKAKDPTPFMHAFRISYSRYFNFKYKSIGCVGNRSFVCVIITSNEQLVKKLIYVLRNSTRHGSEEHPYSDPFNSAKYYFQKERGVDFSKGYYPVEKGYILSYTSKIVPADFMINKFGHIYPPCFLDVSEAELWLGSYREAMEKLSTPTEQEELENDSKNSCRYPYKDITISEIILKMIAPKTIQQLTDNEKLQIAFKIKRKYKVAVRQLSRILGIPESSLRRMLKWSLTAPPQKVNT